MPLTLEPLAPEAVDWRVLDAMPDRVFSQRRAWLNYGLEVSGGKPVFAAVKEAGRTVGCFTGIRFHKFGVPVLGAPFPQWNYPYLGFNLEPGVSRAEALKALPAFAFGAAKCIHLEVADRNLTQAEGIAAYGAAFEQSNFETDLTVSETALLKQMKPNTQGAIKKAKREGVKIEEAAPEGFAEEHYAQLIEVFARQGRKPPYGVGRVRALIKHLHPEGGALLLRARGPDGRSIATGIYAGDNKIRKFWANASVREALLLRPNQLLHYEALLRCKALGASVFEWGGGRYKMAYCPRPVSFWRVQRSIIPAIGMARNLAYDVILAARDLRETLAARFTEMPAAASPIESSRGVSKAVSSAGAQG